jgi:signal transduction histidine kinase
MPEWSGKLRWLMYASIGLLIAEALSHNFRTPLHWVAMIVLGGVLYVIGTNDKFKTTRFLITAILPYLAVTFIAETVRLINIGFFNKWSGWTGTVQTFAVIWGLGTWVVNRRQQKELKKTREKVLKEEQNNKVISAMKEQLEVQVVERTAELTKQKEELEYALHELKSAQAQLIQSEKMASLGELTAGIAHEIQNPLNFVNNFSEVNKELLTEMNDEIRKGNYEDVKLIAKDVIDNEEKINHHGKRADAIVKGMLQHSRTSSGQRELTDINELADEYVRLAYHGLRAKDKSFNAKFETDFDPAIEKINIVPQDVGRVILNLINNAFYAVSEKKKTAGNDYEPTVAVSTKKTDAKVEVRVKDNGNGIPPGVADKIFQPFFTTKPTGQGTGLGLSLSYDIIKAHGGEIKVETKEGKGSEFIIQLSV